MGPTLGKLAGQPARRRRCAGTDRHHPAHPSAFRPFQRAGRRRRRAIYPNAELVLHETEAAFWLDRDEASGATSASAAISPRRASRPRPIASACARVRDGEAMPGVSAMLLRRPYAGPYRLAHPVGQGQPADLGRSRSPRVDPDPAARHRAGLRRRSAGGVRDAPTHVRSHRRRQAHGRRRAPRFSRLRRHRAQGPGLSRFEPDGVRIEVEHGACGDASQ